MFLHEFASTHIFLSFLHIWARKRTMVTNSRDSSVMIPDAFASISSSFQATPILNSTKAWLEESSNDSEDSDGSSDLGTGFLFGTFSDAEEDVLYCFERKKGTDESRVDDVLKYPMEKRPYWADPWVLQRLSSPFRCVHFAHFSFRNHDPSADNRFVAVDVHENEYCQNFSTQLLHRRNTGNSSENLA